MTNAKKPVARKKTAAPKKPASLTALLKRLGWRLAAEGRLLRRTRTPAYREILGDYYVQNLSRGTVDTHVDVVELARQLGV